MPTEGSGKVGRAGDVRLWIFVAVVLALVGFIVYATVSVGGF